MINKIIKSISLSSDNTSDHSSLKDYLQSFKEEIETKNLRIFLETDNVDKQENDLILNYNRKDNHYNSISEYIIHKAQSPEVVNEWKEKYLPMDKINIFIKDLAPDSCYSTILFFGIIQGIPVSAFPKEWLDYIRRWNRGDVKSTGEYDKSWGALLNSLGLEYMPKNRKINSNPERILEGFRASLSFTIELLLNKCDPNNVPSLQHNEFYQRAIAIYNSEKIEYEHILRNSIKIQLLLPLKKSKRRVFVDTIILTEFNRLSTLKNFSRNDKEHSFFGNGFGLMVSHRPDDIDSKYSMSVDPTINVHLEDVWNKLEDIEEEQWEGKRPKKNPRSGCRNKYNVTEPWFSYPDFTLIGSPRSIKDEDSNRKIEGTKLSWNEVLDTLWNLYNPINNLEVLTYNLEHESNQSLSRWNKEDKITNIIPIEIPLQKDKENDEHNNKVPFWNKLFKKHHENKKNNEQDNRSVKKFIGLKWSKTNEENTMVITPTFKQYLVACLQKADNQKISIYDLPNENSFDYIEFPGGFALIHKDGVVFFDDWTKEKTNIDAFFDELKRLNERNNAIETFRRKIKTEFEEIQSNIKDNKKIMKIDIVSLSNKLAKIKINLQNSIFESAPKSNVYEVLQFRETIEKRWGLNSQLNELYAMVSEIENTIKGLVETRTNRVISGITIWGLPITILSTIYQDPLIQLFTKGKLDIVGISLFVGITAVVILILDLIIKRK